MNFLLNIQLLFISEVKLDNKIASKRFEILNLKLKSTEVEKIISDINSSKNRYDRYSLKRKLLSELNQLIDDYYEVNVY